MKKAIFIAASLLTLAAHAQPVYRCGNTYSQQPCEGGAVVKVEDTRSAGQAAAANAETKRAQKAADAMEKSRHEQEARAAPANILQPEKMEAPKADKKADERDPKKHAKKHTTKKPEYFTAVGPKPAKPVKAKKKSAA